MKVLMIFLDGFGLGRQDKNNPYYFARTPFFDKLLGGHILYSNTRPIEKDGVVFIPTDASLQVPGIPQSATGQTALWTGVNAARVVGCHINGFPSEELKNIIYNRSLMKVLSEHNKKVTFANAYRDEYFELVKAKKLAHSTSTLTALTSGQPLRTLDDLKNNNAVYQDFTNKLLVEWGYDVNEITPEQAGRNLAGIANKYDFTLYEYFLTDRAGHKQDINIAVEIYEKLDRFISACVTTSYMNELFIIIASDHGNIEDLSIDTHTNNMIPLLLIHNSVQNTQYKQIKSLTDITPYILKLLGLENGC